jgi:hypothetical protein
MPSSETTPLECGFKGSQTAAGERRTVSIVLRLAGVVLTVFALDALLFRTNIYPPIVEPDSAAGRVQSLLWDEAHRIVTDRNQVLAVGHSRMHLLPRIANELRGTTGYTFASISIGGSTARGWYYMLRDADPTARRYAAILIPVDNYDDPEPHDGDHANWPLDLNYMIGRFRLTDLFDFSRSFTDPEARAQAFRGLLFKGTVYKRDFQEFLKNPAKRLDYVDLVRRESANWRRDYVGPRESLEGLTIDWKTRTAQYPKGLSQQKRDMIRNVLLSPPPPQTGSYGRYQRYWFGRIREHYRGSGTKLIILRLVRGPIVKPPVVPFNPHSSVRELESEPDVIVLNEHLFDELERPELFVDAYHLNAEGAARFSKILVREVRKVLGPPRTSY